MWDAGKERLAARSHTFSDFGFLATNKPQAGANANNMSRDSPHNKICPDTLDTQSSFEASFQ